MISVTSVCEAAVFVSVKLWVLSLLTKYFCMCAKLDDPFYSTVCVILASFNINCCLQCKSTLR